MVEMADDIENYQLLIDGKLSQSVNIIWFYFYILKCLSPLYILMCSA